MATTKRARSTSAKSSTAKAKIASKDTVSVDLSGVEASGRRRKKVIPEGVYRAKVVEAYTKKFSTGRRGVVWVYEVTDKDPKANGARFWNNNVFIDEDGSTMVDSLWTFRGALQALTPTPKVPDKMVNIDLKKYVGRTVCIEVGDGEDDQGRPRSQLLDTFNESELEDESEEDEETEDEDLDEEDEDEEEDEEDDEEEDEEEDDDEVDLDEDELD